MSDKRITGRIPWRAKVRVFDKNTGKELIPDGQIRNLGWRGFAMVSAEELKRGVTYNFEITLIPHQVKMEGRIVHLKNEWKYFLSGVKIETFTLMERAQFNRFMASQSQRIKTKFFGYSVMGGAAAWLLAKILFGVGLAGGLTIFFVVMIVLFIWMPF